MSNASTAPASSSPAAHAADALAKGLEGVVAGETAICSLSPMGGLFYRGYEIHDLAEHATFEEVAHLLLIGHKPSPDELRAFKADIVRERALPAPVLSFLQAAKPMLAAGTAVPMDVLRTAVSILAHLDPDCQDNSTPANLRKAKRLLAKIPTIVGSMQNVIDGRPFVAPETGGDPALGHAANLLYVLTGQKPSEQAARVIDVSLILYAEHEFNASTFTSRVVAATLSDLHGAVCGGIAALKGPLHGGANEAAMEMLKEIRTFVDAGKGSVNDWLQRAFVEKRKLMGFGHRVYKNGDHRAPILNKLGRAAAAAKGKDALRWFEIGDEVEAIMLRDKKIHPNVDFPCGMTYFTLGIPVPQYTPIFVVARITGWAAHVIEQHANNRLIRPLSIYTGPAQRKWNA
ncbi:MAG: citrate/2-methylcitrate synthase [Planctomycetota bacterium]|nr:citrate/2-methylcitrate synthase [Planctomycetota bacterium]